MAALPQTLDALIELGVAVRRGNVKREPEQGLGIQIYDDPDRHGARLLKIESEGPVHQVGRSYGSKDGLFKVGDVIVQVNAKYLFNSDHDDVLKVLQAQKFKPAFTLMVADGAEVDRVVSGVGGGAGPTRTATLHPAGGSLGLQLISLPNDEVTGAVIPGALVAELLPDGIAAASGQIVPGDRLVSINAEPVLQASYDVIVARLKQAGDEVVIVLQPDHQANAVLTKYNDNKANGSMEEADRMMVVLEQDDVHDAADETRLATEATAAAAAAVETEAEREANAKQQRQVEAERENREPAMVAKMLRDMAEMVELNVGGEMVTTTKSTLCAADKWSPLEALFSGRHGNVPTPAFLDVNPRLFAIVLEYLRLVKHGVAPIGLADLGVDEDDDKGVIQPLLFQARHFELKGLEALLASDTTPDTALRDPYLDADVPF